MTTEHLVDHQPLGAACLRAGGIPPLESPVGSIERLPSERAGRPCEPHQTGGHAAHGLAIEHGHLLALGGVLPSKVMGELVADGGPAWTGWAGSRRDTELRGGLVKLTHPKASQPVGPDRDV
jgi:hypothetical protein